MNIKLLKIRPEHLEKIRLWRMSQEVTKYMFTDPIISSENQNEWFKKVIQQDLISEDETDKALRELFKIERK